MPTIPGRCAIHAAFLSLLGADVQPDHGSSGFADDRIAITTPTTFEPGFGREMAGQEPKEDRKNNQACDRKQHRIAKIHDATVVSRHQLVKRRRLQPSTSERCSWNQGGAQPPRLLFGAPSRRTPACTRAPNSERIWCTQWAARARPTAPEAGALPKSTASLRLSRDRILDAQQF